MTARSIGEIVSGLDSAKRTRSFQPVRRNSYYAGEREGRMWRRLGTNNREARRLIGARMLVAERYDRQHKGRGRMNGPLGHIGLEVLRELYRIVDFKSGRLEPAIATICGRIRRCRSAVVAAMARLRKHGFLDWVRRSEPTGNAGAGPQVRQITNAYGFGVPKIAEAWVTRILGGGPPPDCEIARREQDQAETERMLATTSLAECAHFHAGATDLGELLVRLGAKIENSASLALGQNPTPVIS